MTIEDLASAAKELEDLMIRAIDHHQRSQRLSGEDGRYRALRTQLRTDPRLHGILPSVVLDARDTRQLIDLLDAIWPVYDNRRNDRRYIWEEFRPVFQHLEEMLDSETPIEQFASEHLSMEGLQDIYEAWKKIMDRKNSDPRGAITAARTLIESVCHHVVEDFGDNADTSGDLGELYRKATRHLKLSPAQHDEQVYKQILSGCFSVVNGLASLRNNLGDAHGKGSSGPEPAIRHVELAANMAATMATFLVATWHQRRTEVVSH